MKIRNGFVSNSSSTSFAVSISAYPTVRDLAIEMMSIRNSDWDEFDDEEVAQLTIKHAETNDDNILEQIKDIIEFPTNNSIELEFLTQSKIDKDAPTAFHTSNYDTYIKKSGEYIFVATCNNHNWYNISSVGPRQLSNFELSDFKLSDQDIKNLNEGNESFLEILEFGMQYSSEFWWPLRDIKIRQRRNIDKCKNDGCFSILVEIENGEFKCPKCDLGLGGMY